MIISSIHFSGNEADLFSAGKKKCVFTSEGAQFVLNKGSGYETLCLP